MPDWLAFRDSTKNRTETPSVLDTVLHFARGKYERAPPPTHTRNSKCALSHSLTFTCHLCRTWLASPAPRIRQRIFRLVLFFETTMGDESVWASKNLKTRPCGPGKGAVVCQYVGCSCTVGSAEKLNAIHYYLTRPLCADCGSENASCECESTP